MVEGDRLVEGLALRSDPGVLVLGDPQVPTLAESEGDVYGRVLDPGVVRVGTHGGVFNDEPSDGNDASGDARRGTSKPDVRGV